MYRYTTPTITITVEDIDFNDVDIFRIAIKDKYKKYLFEISPDDPNVDAETNTIYLELTQEQTANLREGSAVLQARIRFNDKSVQATEKVNIMVNDVLDEVII